MIIPRLAYLICEDTGLRIPYGIRWRRPDGTWRTGGERGLRRALAVHAFLQRHGTHRPERTTRP